MHRDNNFDFLRFLFAVFIVISHSYPLSGSSDAEQWIFQLTKEQIVLADLGLNGFYIISVFFIYKRFLRSESFLIFFKKRVLRLFPGLFIVLLLSILLVPFVYEGSTFLLSNVEYWTYLPYNLSLYGFQGVVSGVFDTNSFHAINGSLWTIRYEFSLYMVVAFLFLIKDKGRLITIITILNVIFFLILYNFFLSRFDGSSILGMRGYQILNLGGFFVTGRLLGRLEYNKMNKKSLLFCCVVIVLGISLYFGFYRSVKHILLSLLILGVGFVPMKFVKEFGKFGNASYGIYIYGFPIQQTLVYYFDSTTNELIIYSVLISIVIGYLSWHWVEKKALVFKNKTLPIEGLLIRKFIKD